MKFFFIALFIYLSLFENFLVIVVDLITKMTEITSVEYETLYNTEYSTIEHNAKVLAEFFTKTTANEASSALIAAYQAQSDLDAALTAIASDNDEDDTITIARLNAMNAMLNATTAKAEAARAAKVAPKLAVNAIAMMTAKIATDMDVKADNLAAFAKALTVADDEADVAEIMTDGATSAFLDEMTLTVKVAANKAKVASTAANITAKAAADMSAVFAAVDTDVNTV